ncbi:unnamed protein product [Periconia digitata]|uniref:Amidohydrolase-related domain-containing protein n=1 Tax=Periconia digitata TaxID=1303443 RepID=A0A9W4XTC6_9PLEO|nr:unnamed protein product [Periconia digitata]
MASPASLTSRIQSNAARDNIDLSSLPFLAEALTSITNLSTLRSTHEPPAFNPQTTLRIDTHTHPVPPWFRALEPEAAGRATPSWDPLSHLDFMATHDIARSILSVSTPGANAFRGDKSKTVALARLLNEYCAEVVRIWPERFSFLATTALPYSEESVVEVRYAVEELGAVGVVVLTNHEGLYPGDGAFDGVWGYLQGRAEKEGGDGREIVFVHPTEPVIRLESGELVLSKPCKFSDLFFSKSKRVDSDDEVWYGGAYVCAEVHCSSSTTTIWPGGVLLRNCARNFQYHSQPHHLQVPQHPLAHLPRRGCFSRYFGSVPAWISE